MSLQPEFDFDKATSLYEQQSQERKTLQAKGLLPDWYTTQGWQMFKAKYAVPTEEVGVRERYANIAKTLAQHLPEGIVEEYEKKFFDYMWKGYIIPSSPVLANTGTDRGMVVSCSGQVIPDSVDGFYTSLRETALLTKQAFGTSGDFSNIRGRNQPFKGGGKANGAKEVIEDFFTCASKISQGSTRRGSFASYLNVDHPDFYECLESLKIQSNGKNYGWIITDDFINRVKQGDKDATQKWQDILYTKLVTGKGYLFFIDKANKMRPPMYKDKDLDIKATNLCTEIMLHSSEELTYSCILTSINLKHWDFIKTSDVVYTATLFLDCVTSEFIKQSEGVAGMEKVREFTVKGRAIGLGVMGFQTYLQSELIPYDGLEAVWFNEDVFKHMQTETLRASQYLAKELGEPEWCKGYGVRHTHRTTLPPTKSSSILAGNVSESTFPEPAMVYENASAVGELPRISSEFYHLMRRKGKYNKETINSIIEHMGSVQHLDWLDPLEKLVYRTAYEIPQDALYRLASLRQKYLCQGQSINFFFPEDGSEDAIARVMSKVLLDPNILSQYYFYSRSGVVVLDECTACTA